MRVGAVDEPITRALRRSVLRPHLSPADPLPGDELNSADRVHLGALDDDGRLLSTCFIHRDPCPWLPDALPAWRLRQMATAPEARGMGYGAAVVGAAAAYARRQGARVLWCNAREYASGFYARQGFRTFGDVFTDKRHTIPHLRMWLELQPAAASSEAAGGARGG
jgi:GNAT superfamily N-acetyltransferase